MISIASDRMIKKKSEIKKKFSVERTQITVLPLMCSSVNLHATIDMQETTTVINQVAKTDSRRKKTRESACMH